MGMRTIPLMCLLAVLCAGIAAAQSSRDDWKPGSSFDVNAHLTHSLADAPLTSKEREQIYGLIDNQTVHDSFADEQRDDFSRRGVCSGPNLDRAIFGGCSGLAAANFSTKAFSSSMVLRCAATSPRSWLTSSFVAATEADPPVLLAGSVP